MSYRVLARTYRSNTFEEIVGQETIATTLKNAISSGRVHHGYLFTGTRGVGKTSMARILAKALNCLKSDAPATTPCCECDSCRYVATGEDIDVVEIDAASNSGVDNIRELRSNATLRPARARFKIYIIDEVHMLSKEAFNALLKTLEEPPTHVKFILATTEVQKVPATIQSRCQRFDFQSIASAAIAEHLTRILKAEGIEAEEAVLRRIGRLANGSMRDALSLLDKLLSYEPHHLTTAVADEVIPPPHDELAAAVIDCVAQRAAAGSLRALDRALQSGRTVDRFCDHLIEHVRTLMLMRICGEDTELVDVADPMRPTLAAQAAQFDAPTYVYMISLLEELRRHVKFSGAARALADAAVVRLAMSRQFTDINDLLERLDHGESESAAGRTQPTSGVSKKNENADSARTDRESQTTTQPSPAGSMQRRVVHPRRAGGGGRESARAEVPPDTTRLTSAQWERIARDPFVQHVKETVDGTLLDVRPAARPSRAEPSRAGTAEENADDENGVTDGTNSAE